MTHHKIIRSFVLLCLIFEVYVMLSGKYRMKFKTGSLFLFSFFIALFVFRL